MFDVRPPSIPIQPEEHLARGELPHRKSFAP